MPYVPKIHFEGPDQLVIESGGELLVKTGGTITVDGTTYVVTVPDDTTLEINGSDELAVKETATFQADLGDSANGAAIAAAVNGLRDALIAAGIMAAS